MRRQAGYPAGQPERLGRRVRGGSGGSTSPRPTLPGDIVGQWRPTRAAARHHRPARRSPGVTAVITRKTKLQLLAFAVVARARHVLPRLQVRRPGPRCSWAAATTSRPTSRTPAASSSTPRSPTAASRSGRVSDMELIDDGVRVVLTIEPGRRPDPGRHQGGRGHPQRRRRAVRRCCSPTTTRGRTWRTARSSRRTAPSIPVPVEQLLLNMDKLVGSIDQENLRIVVDELGQAFAGAGRRPRPADRQRQPAARPRRAVAAADAEADHRRADRPRHPGGQPLGDPAVGLGPAAGDRHPGRHRPRPARAAWSTRPTPAAAIQTAGRGRRARVWARWCATSTSSTRSPSRGWTASSRCWSPTPTSVSGGFTVVRNDSGVMRAHFGFVLNSGDPHACISRLPVDSRRRRSPGAVATSATP